MLLQNSLRLLIPCDLIHTIPGSADLIEFTEKLSHKHYPNKWRKAKNLRLEKKWQSASAVKDAHNALSRQVILVGICGHLCIVLSGIDILFQVPCLNDPGLHMSPVQLYRTPIY